MPALQTTSYLFIISFLVKAPFNMGIVAKNANSRELRKIRSMPSLNAV